MANEKAFLEFLEKRATLQGHPNFWPSKVFAVSSVSLARKCAKLLYKTVCANQIIVSQ